jgi:hypothetical protein
LAFADALYTLGPSENDTKSDGATLAWRGFGAGKTCDGSHRNFNKGGGGGKWSQEFYLFINTIF